MNRSLHIVVADDEPDMQEYYRTMLPDLGHLVKAVATSGRDLVEKCQLHHPDLVITDIKMPDMDGIEAAALIYRDAPVPIILVSAFNDPDFIRRAEVDYILAYLVKPIKKTDLQPAISQATHRFDQFEAMLKETTNLKQALEDRKLIERAKEVLMKKGGINESDAFRQLQTAASERNQTLIEMAEMILREIKKWF